MLETLLGIRGEEFPRGKMLLERGADNKQICTGCNNVCQAGRTVHTYNHVTIAVGGYFFQEKRQGKSQCHLSFICALLLEISLGGCGVSIPALQFSSFTCLHFNRGFPLHMWLCCWACEILVPSQGWNSAVRSTDS